MAASRLVRTASFCVMSVANACIHSRTASREIGKVAIDTALPAPAQCRGLDWRIPQPRKFVVEPEQRDRTASHFKGRDIGSDQVAADFDAAACQYFLYLVIHDIQFDKRC